jgi:hypothetical protein
MIDLKLNQAQEIRAGLVSLLQREPKGFTATSCFQSGKLPELLESKNDTNAISIGLSAQRKQSFGIEIRVYSKGAVELAKTMAKQVDEELKIDSVPKSPVFIRVAKPGRMFNATSRDPKLEAFDKHLQPHRKKNRPLFIGQAIGNLTNRHIGTVSIGGFVVLKNSEIGILSASHGLIGLGETGGDVGNRVSQPHYHETKYPDASDVFGHILFASALKPDSETVCDAAVVGVRQNPDKKDEKLVLGNYIPKKTFDPDLTTHLSSRGMPDDFFGSRILPTESLDFYSKKDVEQGRVYKIGAGSGWSAGELGAQGGFTDMTDKGETYRFMNTIEVRGLKKAKKDPKKIQFSNDGDSGALVFYRRGKHLYALGLIIGQLDVTNLNRRSGRMAVYETISIVCPLLSINEFLNAKSHSCVWMDSEYGE